MCYLCNKEMRLEGCVRREVMMRFRGTLGMLYVHKHRTTFPRDDECGCAQYDDEGVHEVHDIRGSTDLQTSLQICLTREGLGGV